MDEVVAPAKLISDRLNEFVLGFWTQVPNIIAALAFLIIVYLLAKLFEHGIARFVEKRGRPDLGALVGTLLKVAILLAAFLFAAAIVFPSIKPSDVFATLGIGSVAIGFAFKDILQNLLAGLLLLINRPYRRGDQIKIKGFEGTVIRIETRATVIRTYDGRRVLIPNSDAYTSAVIVNTAHPERRSEIKVGIGYGDDVDRAVEVFTAAVCAVEGVLKSPVPEVLPKTLNDSTVDLIVRWWAGSERVEQVHTRAAVVKAIFHAAKEHDIDLPFPTQVMLFHDQTEEGSSSSGPASGSFPARASETPAD